MRNHIYLPNLAITIMNKKSKSTENKLFTESILNPDDIKKIRSFLSQKPRDLLLFNLAINTGSKMKDILSLKVRDLQGVKIGNEISIHPNNGNFHFMMDKTIHKSFKHYLKNTKMVPDDYLFTVRNSRKPLSMSRMTAIIKGWFADAQIEGNHGAVSLRKTWEHSMKGKNLFNSSSLEINPMDIFQPIKTQTAQQRIYNNLSKAIISGEIPPGTKLTAAEISKAFNVSEAPVRVALYWLEAKRFITTQKKKASIVNKLSMEELKEIMEIRLSLETLAIKSSINVCTEDTLSLAESITELEKKASSLNILDKYNTEFHQILYRDAKKPILLQLISDLCARISPYAIIHFKHERMNKNFNPSSEKEYHRKIIESMRNMDLGGALKNLELDLDKGMAALEKLFEEESLLVLD